MSANKTDNYEDDEFDRELEKIEEIEKNLDLLYQQIDTSFDWLSLYQNMPPVIERFNRNIQSIDFAAKTLTNKNENKEYFLIGTLMGGVISAYEGMVHEFVDLLINSKIFTETEIIKKIQSRGIIRIEKGEELNRDSIAALLRNETLNHPNRVGKLLTVVFGFKLKKRDEKQFTQLIKMRNSFTHNNGVSSEGHAYTPSWQDLEALLIKMTDLAADYVHSINTRLDKFLKEN